MLIPKQFCQRASATLRVRATLLCAASLLWTLPAPAAATSPELLKAAQHNNIGVAYMNEQSPEKALAEFQAASQADPAQATSFTNAGLALLYLRRIEEAESEFRKALAVDSHDAAAWYCLGLTFYNERKETEALDAFRQAETLAPGDPDTHYFAGAELAALQQFSAATQEFAKAIQGNPLYASAEFGLARSLQHLGDPAGARVHLARFSAISKAGDGVLITSTYGEQGRFARARDILPEPPAAAAMIPVSFAPVEGQPTQATPVKASGAACLIRMGDRRYLLLPSARVGLAVIRVAEDGKLQDVPAEDLHLHLRGDGVGCAVGDYDNDGQPDVALSMADRVVLLHNDGAGHLEDKTEAAGLHESGQPGSLMFVDFDHDGDLDLLVTGAGGNQLWRNNGNATFTAWTQPAALGGHGATRAAVLSDVNNDRADDLIVAGEKAPPTVFLNQREGPFQARPLWNDASVAPARALAVADFNKDGWMDLLVAHSGRPGLSLWRNTQGRGFERVSLPLKDDTAGWAAIPIDFDNDGWIDIAALVETPRGPALKILRNLGSNHFQDVTAQLGLDGLDVHGARDLIAADLTGHAASDLLISFTDRPPLILRNAGGDRHHALRLRLTGFADNKSAIGTKVEVFSGTGWQKFEVNGAQGYMGQGSSEILAGLGDTNEADVVRLLWPTGVPQDEIHLPASKAADLTELDRRGSSCPVLFAWDGTRYRFVSDVIGAAVVGHWISPTGRNRPDPDEWAKIDGDLLKPYQGKLSVRFGEPMEEVNYIDQLRLMAVDHPAATAAYPDERFLEAPPFASGKPILVSSSAHPPVAAWDDHGRDALPAIARLDHHYLRDFTNLSYAGFANEHTLTLDIGRWTPSAPLRLVLSGYVEYFSASSMYAAWQAGMAQKPPMLEAQQPDGRWTTAIADMGFPAGLPRTIVVDLTGKLKAGVHRLRLRTNLQIYWDQVLIDNASLLATELRTTEVPLATADLEFRGYPRQIEGPTPGELTYDYQSISETGPFAWQRGAYTHYGDVTPLLAAVDNRPVVFGSGQDIDAEFDPSTLPPVPRGWKRDYFFYANGFVKDMDFYDASPFTVGQLPFHGMKRYPYAPTQHFPDDAAAVAYRLRWNDRLESGRRSQRFAFRYRAVHPVPIVGEPADQATSGGTR